MNNTDDYVIRRLTPLECERLQGYPDGWTDIEYTDDKGKLKRSTDAPRYKALGNSIAVPCVQYIMEGLALEGAKTLGSLFDGIGGFPLAAYRCDIDTKWTSEIEEFPIEVVKKHFGDAEGGIVGDIEQYENK